MVCAASILLLVLDPVAVTYGTGWMIIPSAFLRFLLVLVLLAPAFAGTLRSRPDGPPLSLNDILLLNQPCRWLLVVYFVAIMAAMVTAILGWWPLDEYIFRPSAWVCAISPLAIILLWAEFIRESSTYLEQ